MGVRVTQTMLNTQLLRNLSNNMSRLDKLQSQMSTGRVINKPSDDPVGISFSLRYRSELAEHAQYQRNIDGALSWLEYTDTMLDQTVQVIHRARELAVQGANGTNPQEALNIIAKEIKQLYEQLVDIGNSRFNGKYVFNGEMTDLQPYTMDKAPIQGTDSGKIEYEIGVGVRIAINVTGEDVFGKPGETSNLFLTLRDLVEKLESGNISGVSNVIERLDQRLDKILGVRADIGAKTNRVELAEERIKDININLESLQSKTEDADLAEVIMRLKMDENVYQASLAAGARLIRPSLVDFLN
jgi:flagellar hook-associated protein 3 FlgL